MLSVGVGWVEISGNEKRKKKKKKDGVLEVQCGWGGWEGISPMLRWLCSQHALLQVVGSEAPPPPDVSQMKKKKQIIKLSSSSSL